MPAILHPYQRRWLDDQSRFKAGMFARQTGKTFTTTLEIAEDIIDHDIRGERSRWVILSRGERQAKEAMEEGLNLHLKALGAGFDFVADEDSGYRWEDGAKVKAQETVLKNGSRVTALPSNPDTARGFSANVFLDEFAFHRDSRKIWTALFPVISKPGLKLRVVSTPNGKGNKFYDLITGKSDRWSRHIVDIYQAVAEGLPRDIAELQEGCGDDDAWRQEYELEFMDEASAWLPWEMINGVEHDRAGIPENYAGGPVFVGVDIGRRNDLFVIWVVEEVVDVLWTRDVIARKRISFAEQDALLAGVFDQYRVARCCMDQTGMGEKPVEDARRSHGESRVEGVIFTSGNKLTLATIGKERFEDRTIRIPLGDKDIRDDLHKLQKVSGPTGAPRFVAESDSAGHADRAWACFLACNAAANAGGPVEYASVTKRGTARGY
ncbi:terminase family protein [Desulfosarcina sp. OttesenSCG-928-B08]|nr:terminase family protein [Desulfosarcina sp. OttesenSCG-928-B08]